MSIREEIEKLSKNEELWRTTMMWFLLLLIVTFVTFDVLLWAHIELR